MTYAVLLMFFWPFVLMHCCELVVLFLLNIECVSCALHGSGEQIVLPLVLRCFMRMLGLYYGPEITES